jgi:hypothetical protein
MAASPNIWWLAFPFKRGDKFYLTNSRDQSAQCSMVFYALVRKFKTG